MTTALQPSNGPTTYSLAFMSGNLSEPAAPRRVHIVGAGPVGLLLTALLQSMDGFSVRLYEKRHTYTRTRMVQLAPYLMADSLESYRTDGIDGDSIEAIFDPPELGEGLAFRQSIPGDLTALLRDWSMGFVPAERDRAVGERPDRRARVDLGRAHRRCRVGRATRSRCSSRATS